MTHPLAGIPAVIYALMVAVVTWDQPPLLIKRMLATLIVLSGAVALPIVFVIQAKLAQLPVLFSPEGLFDFEKLALTGFFANRFSTWFDGLYLVIANHLWILIVLAAVGLLIAWRHGADKKIHLPLIAAGMWIINYWLLSTTLEFSFLIEYERTNYAERLLIISMLFLIPHVGIALAGIMDHFKARPKILSTSVAILLALMVLANVYGAYPRHDNYARSAGFNVGESDIDAVYAINETGGEQDYIVLANQAVSAAALETFGFKQYYKDDIFYYPIPTGGILYNYYLEMADEGPRRETALEAMDVAGVDLAFFVINDYWWQSEIIREHAKQEADDWFSTGDDAVTVFVYRR
ncbi:hypothetical protein IH979_01100 [Patescibacteria group bacterium]|nr:hypothetical protein [Patescibacteria group bacterium]